MIIDNLLRGTGWLGQQSFLNALHPGRWVRPVEANTTIFPCHKKVMCPYLALLP